MSLGSLQDQEDMAFQNVRTLPPPQVIHPLGTSTLQLPAHLL